MYQSIELFVFALNPQIIGLTASPSICGNTDDDKARDCIMEMCATLDTHLIHTVQQHKIELQVRDSHTGGGGILTC